ncbi:MAG: cytochrome-c peroxidase [Planctomycetes bacterium]|nr:cytochrome-c peroxidase [Planctomycetota bacterium]
MRTVMIASFLWILNSCHVAQDLPHLVTAVPFGLPAEMNEPEESRPDPARIALGRRLFFDPILSRTREISCASCHDPKHGWSSPDARSRGVEGRITTRHSPTLLNRAYGRRFMWDGRASSLEEQVLQPIENPLEMDLSLAEALDRLQADEDYVRAFQGAWSEAPTQDRLARSLAIFVRRIQIGNSPIDRFRSGVFEKPLTPAARTGPWIYESKGRCWQCHTGSNFSDEDFHNTGVGVLDDKAEKGRMDVTQDERDRGRFKTPTLRGLSFTAPYMHDGSLPTLRAVVDFYRAGGGDNPNLDRKMQPIELSDREAEGLVAFLEALSREAP